MFLPDRETYIHHTSSDAFAVASCGGDAITIAISLSHKAEPDRLLDISRKVPATKVITPEVATEISQIIIDLQTIGLPYLENGIDILGTNTTLQNYQNFIVQLAGGNSRILLHIFADVVQSLSAARKEDRKAKARPIFDIYAPEASRFRLPIYTPMRNRAFALSQPEEYQRTKQAINAWHDIDYDTLELATVPLRKELGKVIKASDPQAKAGYRKKDLLAFPRKVIRKPEEYPEVEYIKDLALLRIYSIRALEPATNPPRLPNALLC